MRFLRSNTAVIVTVGPFYDKTDGVTIETGLTITNERITLTADTDDNSAPTNILDNVTGATSGTSNDLNYITGNDAGMMQLELSAANTNRLGRMFLSITDAANHVPVFHEFMVLNTALYDALFASSGGAIPNAVAGAAGGVFIAGTNAATTVTTSLTTTFTGNLTGSIGSVASGGITATSIAADAIGASELAADAVAEIADAVWDEDATGHQTQGTFGQAIGDPASDSDTIWGLASTNLNATVSSRASQTSVDTVDDFLDTEIAAIKAKTDLIPGALTVRPSRSW
jgi:hypothetical protein